MTAELGRNRCFTCKKEKATSLCGGCKQNFCWNDLFEHRQKMVTEADDILTERNLLREKLTEHDSTSKTKQNSLIVQIEKWEKVSIETIRRTAEFFKEEVLDLNRKTTHQLEEKLNKLTNEIRQRREENDFFEIDLKRWRETLADLTKELTESTDFVIRSDSESPFINSICIEKRIEKQKEKMIQFTIPKTIPRKQPVGQREQKTSNDGSTPVSTKDLPTDFKRSNKSSLSRAETCQHCHETMSKYELPLHEFNCERNPQRVEHSQPIL